MIANQDGHMNQLVSSDSKPSLIIFEITISGHHVT